MYIEKFQNAAGSKITVTATATGIYDLINTAQSTTLTRAGFSVGVNAIVIQPEDGDVRYLMDGNTPTAANGFLISSGQKAVLLGVPLDKLKLIRTGGTNVVCSIQLGRSRPEESPSFAGGGSSSVSISSALPAGNNNIGDVDVASLPALPAGNNNIGDVDVASIAAGTNLIGKVNLSAQTSGGYTPTKTISQASTNATVVKGSAGQIGYIYASNINASPRYLKLYNKATSPTVGTDTPVHTFIIPGNTEGRVGGLSNDLGIEFTTGIGFALTTGVADSDTGAVAANELVVNIGYK